MAHPSQNYGAPFSSLTAGTTDSVATIANPGTSSRVFVTDVAGQSDQDGWSLSVRNGSTLLYQIGSLKANVPFRQSFEQPLMGTSNSALTIQVGSAAAVSWANISGYTI